jgi:hypothetical protein
VILVAFSTAYDVIDLLVVTDISDIAVINGN